METTTDILSWSPTGEQWFWVIEVFEGRSCGLLSEPFETRAEAERAKRLIDADRTSFGSIPAAL